MTARDEQGVEKDVPASHPFVTYTRTVEQTKSVATVTVENIGTIAARIGGTVDYSGDEPVLLDPHHPRGPWRVKVGWQVSMMNGGLMNQSGFNRDGDWARVTPPGATS